LVSSSTESSRATLLSILGLSVALNLTAVWWGLPSKFGWAVDELNPSVILAGIEVRFSGDWHHPSYPPFHHYLLALTYLPVLALDLVDPRSVEGHTLFFYFGRMISIAMSAGAVVLVSRLGALLFDARSGLFAALVTALQAPFVYYGKFANLDVPLTFWVLLSLYFFVRVVRKDELRDYLLFTLTAVLATVTKDQAYAFYVLPLAVLAAGRLRRGTLLDRRIGLSILLGTISFLAVHNVWFNYRGFMRHLDQILWARSNYNAFENTILGQLGILRQTVVHIGFSLGWPLALAAFLGVGLSLREGRNRPLPLWVLLSCVSYYVFFIAPVLSPWLRYCVPLSTILALFAGNALARVWPRAAAVRMLAAAALLYSLARALSVDVLLLRDSRYDAERWLHANVGPGEVVGYVAPEYYLPRLHELSAKRLRPTQTVLEREGPDFLVLNPDFAERFEPGSREEDLFSNLEKGRTSYGLVYRQESKSAPLLNLDGILDNMSKISPVVEVYQRAR
jgi:4-amino-4-deoxy-L-arabinose transferase-like glycosyltransferase